MGFGKQLEQKMKDKGVKQTELAAAVGLPKTTLSSMILRDNTKVEIEVFLKICEYLDCTPEDFYPELKKAQRVPPTFAVKYNMLDAHGKELVTMVLDKELERCTMQEETKKADRHTWTVCYSEDAVSAGNGYALDEYERMGKLEVVDTPEARRADFAVKITGDSMEPSYSDDDIVLVQQVEQIEEGEVGIFFVNGSGYVKEYGSDRLISHNSKYEDIVLHEYDTMRCFGKVIGVAELPDEV